MNSIYTPTFCVPTAARNTEIEREKSIARQEFDELNRQAAKTGQAIFAGRLIPIDELNNALDATL